MRLAIYILHVKSYNLRIGLLISMEEISADAEQNDQAQLDKFSDRLKQAVGDNSIRGFARECGFSDTVLRQYLNGQSEPTRPALLAIARTANVSVEWLAVGQSASRGETLTERYIYKEPLAFEISWLQTEFPDFIDNLLIAQVPDDSMEPTLKVGACILVNTHDRDWNTITHGVYLLKLDDQILVKRLQYMPERRLKLMSDHPAYEAFSISLADRPKSLSLMGNVVWCGQKL